MGFHRRLGVAALLAATAIDAQTSTDSARRIPSLAALAADSVGSSGAMTGLPRLERGVAVSVIDARRDDLADAPSLPIALQARAPGVSVSQGEGFLGSSARVWLRGPGSLMVNEPLLIIDGARTHASHPFRGPEEQQLPSRLEDVDPETIERVEVLSGIGASAIYGPGASKGVILVTTRRGAPGPARWRAFAESGPLTEVTDFPANFGTPGVSPGNGSPIQYCYLEAQASGSCIPTAVRSWNPLESASPFRTGWSSAAGLSVSGGTRAMRYFAAGNHDRTTGVYATDRARTTNGRIALSVAPVATVDLTLTGGYRTERYRHPWGSYITDGLLGESVDDPERRGYRSTPQELELGTREEHGNRATVALNGVWQPSDWLRASAVVGYDRLVVKHASTLPPSEFPPGSGSVITMIGRGMDAPATRSAAVDATASYGLTGVDMRSTVGVQYIRDDDRANTYDGDWPCQWYCRRTSLRTRRPSTGIYLQQHAGWHDRVFVTGSFRMDRPSESAIGDAFSHSVDISWTAIGSAGAASSRAASGLRFRAAYGHGGGHFLESAQLDDSFFGLGPSPETAERSTGFEVGVDASLFGSRLWLTGTGYRATNDQGLMLTVLSPGGGGPGQAILNDARFRTSGFEGSIDARLHESARVTWDLGLMLSAQRNEVRSLPTGPLLTANRQSVAVGGSIGEYRPTSYTYADANGDGIITMDEVTISSTESPSLGSPFPDYEGALRTEAAVGTRLRLSAVVERRGGQSLYRPEALRCRFLVCEEQHDPTTSLEDQAGAVVQRNELNPAHYIERAGYTKLREVTLAIALPRAWAAVGGAHEARVTITGRNLHTWTSYRGFDPEFYKVEREGALANRELFQPPLRSFTARLDLAW